MAVPAVLAGAVHLRPARLRADGVNPRTTTRATRVGLALVAAELAAGAGYLAVHTSPVTAGLGAATAAGIAGLAVHVQATTRATRRTNMLLGLRWTAAELAGSPWGVDLAGLARPTAPSTGPAPSSTRSTRSASSSTGPADQPRSEAPDPCESCTRVPGVRAVIVDGVPFWVCTGCTPEPAVELAVTR